MSDTPHLQTYVVEYPSVEDAPRVGGQMLGGKIVRAQFSDALEEIETLIAERDEARAELSRFIANINGPTHMGEPVITQSGDRDAYEGCREDLLVWKRRAQKAEAELARLTTLRPCSEWKQGEEVIWHFAQRPRMLLSRNNCSDGALGWTHAYIPTPKEPTP